MKYALKSVHNHQLRQVLINKLGKNVVNTVQKKLNSINYTRC